jgi:hypothetical protein
MAEDSAKPGEQLVELKAAIPPAELVYVLHVAWDQFRTDRRYLTKIERAIVTSTNPNTEYAQDVAVVWACLFSRCRDRLEATSALPVQGSPNPTFRNVAEALRSGHTSPPQVSYLRYLLVQKYAVSMLVAVPTPLPRYPSKIHADRFFALISAFSHDCTFVATGDWMIDAQTTLLCPAWQTCVTDGNEAPYTVASKLHLGALNDLLRPVIKTPIHEQISDEVDDGVKAFVSLYAVIREIVPSTPVAINAEIFNYIGTQVPVPFFLNGLDLGGVVNKMPSCHGFMIGSMLIVYNGRGVLDAATDWLYAMWLTGDAPDAAEFVFVADQLSDGNPFYKYLNSINGGGAAAV